MKIEIPDNYFNKEELENTPKRIEKIFTEEIPRAENFKFTTFPANGYDEMIVWKGKDISICSHHLFPFEFEIAVGYIPNKLICGLSKIPRVIRKFAFKPQLQEKLTCEIADFLIEKLKPKGVMVVITGRHLCCSGRGIRADGNMITSAVRGVFKKPPKGLNPRQEFLSLMELATK